MTSYRRCRRRPRREMKSTKKTSRARSHIKNSSLVYISITKEHKQQIHTALPFRRNTQIHGWLRMKKCRLLFAIHIHTTNVYIVHTGFCQCAKVKPIRALFFKRKQIEIPIPA